MSFELEPGKGGCIEVMMWEWDLHPAGLRIKMLRCHSAPYEPLLTYSSSAVWEEALRLSLHPRCIPLSM